MKIENYIESQYRELTSSSPLNLEFVELYSGFFHTRLREILATLHYELISLFRSMNNRLPTDDTTAHFWAEPSRRLIFIIEIILGLFHTLKQEDIAFDIDTYYLDIILKCRDFLSPSGGSTLPPHMSKVDLYYTIPIFAPCASVSISNPRSNANYILKQIGSGSYAIVFRYKDEYYDKYFVVKRAKKDLTDKELVRFEREYIELKDMSSPYIIEVHRYDEDQNEYVMEHMDYTLEEFIQKNNSSMPITLRKSIVNQILRAFDYIHSKNRLHRDISPKNILLKEYDDTLIVKVSDFGLVKIPDSTLTSASTEFKGYFNDPSLVVEGFDNYSILHETYALTRIVYYVMTGKTNTDGISNPELKSFVSKGLSVNKSSRFRSVAEMTQALRVPG